METIAMICVTATGAYIPPIQYETYPEGTWAELIEMEHPELPGLDIPSNAGRWDYYWIEGGEQLFCNADGKIEAR